MEDPKSIDDASDASPNNSSSNTSAPQTGLRPNPLTQFSSNNYVLTLYMVTPECANYYANTGKFPENSGSNRWIIVAQTGGINNYAEYRGLTNDKKIGIGKGGLDYQIDNLNIESYMLAQDKQRTASFSMMFNFDVIEATGFTFLNRLSDASRELNQLSGVLSQTSQAVLPNLYQQHYFMGIKFYGYDSSGKMLSLSDVSSNESVTGDSSALYERLFPILCNKVNFKLDGRYTVYSFESTIQHLQATFGIKRGILPAAITVEGTTVEDILGDEGKPNTLIGAVNKLQAELIAKESSTIPNSYKIEWVSNNLYDSSPIKSSSLLTDEEYNEANKMNTGKETKESTVKMSASSTSVDRLSRSVTIGANTSIISAIDQIISKSKYISGKLSTTTGERIENKHKKNSGSTFAWFSINPITEIKGRDEKLNDWVYDITYQIIPYDVSYIRSSYVDEKSKYPGPVKRYEYLFTGNNTDILSFEVEYNNMFYIVEPTPVSGTVPSTDKTSSAPKSATGGVDDSSGTTTKHKGSQILETVRASLYNPADMAVVNMRIIGDPDFLTDTMGMKLTDQDDTKYFAKNGTIKPQPGQVYAEVTFKIAEDYSMETGLMDVDPSQTISFYKVEDQKKLNTDAIIYRINSVKSTFRGGKFEQDLEMIIVDPSELLVDSSSSPTPNSTASNEEQRSEQAAATSSASSQPATNNRSATSAKTPTSSSFSYRVPTASDYAVSTAPTTNTSNDDATANTGNGWTSHLAKANPGGLTRPLYPKEGPLDQLWGMAKSIFTSNKTTPTPNSVNPRDRR